METVTYQVERARIGTQSWEQLKPLTPLPEQAMLVMSYHALMQEKGKVQYHFRLVRHTSEVVRSTWPELPAATEV